MSQDQLAEVERKCKEALAASEFKNDLVAALGCGSDYEEAGKVLGICADHAERLEAGFWGMSKQPDDDESEFYALGARLRAECLAEAGK